MCNAFTSFLALIDRKEYSELPEFPIPKENYAGPDWDLKNTGEPDQPAVPWKPGQPGVDENGEHGDRVLSLITGKTFGVSRKVTPVIIRVKDFDDPHDDVKAFIVQLNWIIQDWRKRRTNDKVKKVGIINLSQGANMEFDGPEVDDQLRGNWRDLAAKIRALADEGLLLINSAGNEKGVSVID